MFRFLGDGHTYVIFDCAEPSFINDKHQKTVLKHHIINHMLDRKKDPRYNDTDGYVCDADENLWRMNTKERGCTPGLISFMAKKAYAADSNFIVLADEQMLKDYFGKIVLETPQKDKDKASQHYASIIKTILTAIHHPAHFKLDPKLAKASIDLLEAAERHLPKEVKVRRKSDKRIIQELFSEKLGDSPPALAKDDAYSFIVMNCSRPEYLSPLSVKSNRTAALVKFGLEKREITNRAHVELLKQMARCDRKEQIWYLRPTSSERSAALQYLTYNRKTSGLSCLPGQEQLSMLSEHDLCHDYMAYLLHPGYYELKQFKKPRQCSKASKSSVTFRELSVDAWQHGSGAPKPQHGSA